MFIAVVFRRLVLALDKTMIVAIQPVKPAPCTKRRRITGLGQSIGAGQNKDLGDKMGGTVRAVMLAATVAILGVGEAQAGAFGIREQSTEAQGLAFAGAASGSGGVSSIFWNPATITMNPG